MKKIIIVLILLLPVFFCISTASAQRGCCSWHKGVCGCDPSGRKICCDGTLSPSCTCAVYDYDDNIDIDEPAPTPPTPAPAPVRKTVAIPEFPVNNLSPEISLTENLNKTYDVFVNWNDVEDVKTRDYSIGMKANAGDPGPLPDTTKSEYTFENIKPGKYTISLKTKVGDIWSKYISWDNIEIPGEYKTKSLPTIENLQNELIKEQQQSDDRKNQVRNLEEQLAIFKRELEKEKHRTGSDKLDLTFPLLASLGGNIFLYRRNRKFSKNLKDLKNSQLDD